MTSQGGMGLTAKIEITGVLTAIVDVLEGSELPKMKKIIADMTPHNATQGYTVRVATGKRSLESFKLVVGWDKDEVTHAALQTAFDSEEPVNMSIASPSDDEVIAFAAHIEEIARLAPTEDGFTAELTITPTGAPSIT